MDCPECGRKLVESKYGLFLECKEGHFAIEETRIEVMKMEKNKVFKEKLLTLRDKKKAKLKELEAKGLEGEIPHSILKVEIGDVIYALRALKQDNTHKLNLISGITTSGSLLDAINEYMK